MKTLSNIEGLARKNAKKAQARYEELKSITASSVKKNKDAKAEAFREKCRLAVEELRIRKGN